MGVMEKSMDLINPWLFHGDPWSCHVSNDAIGLIQLISKYTSVQRQDGFPPIDVNITCNMLLGDRRPATQCALCVCRTRYLEACISYIVHRTSSIVRSCLASCILHPFSLCTSPVLWSIEYWVLQYCSSIINFPDPVLIIFDTTLIRSPLLLLFIGAFTVEQTLWRRFERILRSSID